MGSTATSERAIPRGDLVEGGLVIRGGVGGDLLSLPFSSPGSEEERAGHNGNGEARERGKKDE